MFPGPVKSRRQVVKWPRTLLVSDSENNSIFILYLVPYASACILNEAVPRPYIVRRWCAVFLGGCSMSTRRQGGYASKQPSRAGRNGRLFV